MAATTLSVTAFYALEFHQTTIYITLAHGSHRLHGFFARATCFNTTEMTDFTDFVSIACSLRH